MGADTVISGVVRAVLPYAALAGAGFVGYTWLNKKGYLNGIKDGINGTVDSISQVPTKIVDIFRDRTGINNFEDGDWIGGAQKIVRNIPLVNLGEKGFNAAKDWMEDILPDDPPKLPDLPIDPPKLPDLPIDPPKLPDLPIDPPKLTEENTGIPESTWTDTPLKYVPAVAIRNAITSNADNIGKAVGNIGNTVGNTIGNAVKKFKFW